MKRLFAGLVAGWLGGAAMALLLTTPAAAADEVPKARGSEVVEKLRVMFPAGVKPGDYWLGISVGHVNETLREQLTLPEGQGLLVTQVMPDTPAARAEVKRHDIVLKANGKPLGEIHELIDAVDAAKEAEVSLEIIRRGKPITIKAKPEKRPEDEDRGLQFGFPPQSDLGRAFELGVPNWSPHRRFSPGVILPPGAPVHAPLPGDLSITIRKQGEEPAKIEARRGDESWSVNENELDSLPPEIAIHVGRMLGGVPLGSEGVRVMIAPRAPPAQNVLPSPPTFMSGIERRIEDRLEKRFEEMGRQIERMQKMLEGLRDDGLPAGSSEKKPPQKNSPREKTPKEKQKQA